MKFLCLGYLDSAKMDARPKEETAAVMRQCQPHLEELYKSGQVMIDAGLASETISLRRANGKIKVMDGPFIETKEMIGSVDWQRFSHRSTGHGGSNSDSLLTSDRTGWCGRAIWLGD